MDKLGEKPAGQLAKAAGRLVSIGLLLSILPSCVQIFGFQFLPSAEWTVSSFVAGIAGGLLGAILLFWLIVIRIDSVPGSELKKLCAVLVSPFIGFFLARNIVVIAGPMIVALIAGQQTELPYVVDNATRSGSRGCSSPLSFQGLPFLFDRLCGVRSEFRRGLTRDTKIVVTGRGTSYGIFADGMHRLD